MAKAFTAYFARLLYWPPEVDRIQNHEESKPPTTYCFLSHCAKDKEFCNKLYSDLLASGINCWYFPEDATFGKKVWSEIDNSIASSHKVIAVCSRHSLQSAPVLREIERALNREDSENTDILLPISIDNFIFDNWKHHRKIDVINKVVGDFQTWENQQTYKKSLIRLISAIGK